MPTYDEVERAYRELSARLAYCQGEVDPQDARRLEDLAELRVQLTAPDFRSYAATA